MVLRCLPLTVTNTTVYFLPAVRPVNCAFDFCVTFCFDPLFSFSRTSYCSTPPDGTLHETVIDVSLTIALLIFAAFGAKTNTFVASSWRFQHATRTFYLLKRRNNIAISPQSDQSMSERFTYIPSLLRNGTLSVFPRSCTVYTNKRMLL